MSPERKRVLVVGVTREEFGRAAPLLDRAELDVDRFPSAQGAVELVTRAKLDLLIARYPLPGMDPAAFLTATRDPASASRGSSVLLLAVAGHLGEATTLLGRGANRVVSLANAADHLPGAVAELTHIAPRTAIRVTTRLQAVVHHGSNEALVCQTENLSRSGMLVHAARDYGVGTRIRFEFQIPSDRQSATGVAEVVRRSTRAKELMDGLGLRFVSFEGDGLARLETYLNHR